MEPLILDSNKTNLHWTRILFIYTAKFITYLWVCSILSSSLPTKQSYSKIFIELLGFMQCKCGWNKEHPKKALSKHNYFLPYPFHHHIANKGKYNKAHTQSREQQLLIEYHRITLKHSDLMLSLSFFLHTLKILLTIMQ